MIGGFAVAGAFYHYVLFAVGARTANGKFQASILNVVNRTEDAPAQYRIFVPETLNWFEQHTPLSLEQVTILFDGAVLALGVGLGVMLLRARGLKLLTLPALLYCAFMIVGMMSYPHPETIAAFVCVNLALFALVRPPAAEDWWPPVLVWGMLVLAAAALTGLRTDLLFALAAGFAVRWLRGRQLPDLVAAIGLGLTAVVATLAVVRLFPAAKYPSDTDVVQITWNLGAYPFVVALCFLAPALGPLALLLRQSNQVESLQRAAQADVALIAVIAGEFATSVVVGRINEIRLLFPVTFCLILVGAELWRAMIQSLDREPVRIE